MDLARGIIDAAVIGEGEFTAQELFAKWDKGDFESPTPGVCHRTEIGEVIEGPTRPMMDLKDLPPPDFGDFNLSSYTSKQLPSLISRGCA
ncbi:MAG: hypothetical protein HRT44_03095, partial [Bdellovibrionales bacterium]|nr:hypothetical protein [Bdellovibrionales bacterium]